jgi:peptidoglycan/xylan/chitin deacetylase (PgdA/CDA1 family)
MSGRLVISLDFELHWGVRDHMTVEKYRSNLIGVRRAVPEILRLFREHAIHATWATVGFLFAETREELLAGLPEERPAYTQPALDPYRGLEQEVGADEVDDPFHFAASLIRTIAETPHQEVGTHTFSHYYCLEPGQDEATFAADLRAAAMLAARRGVTLSSLVFPRNQVNPRYLETCRFGGIVAYRGPTRSWLYVPRAESEESWVRRGLRLIDAYAPLSGDNSYRLTSGGTAPVNVSASRFLRPWSSRLRLLEPLRMRRIERDLERAARGGRIYHLWWHPHNFGTNLEPNLAFLRKLLERYTTLRGRYGMQSVTMGELARELATVAA